MERPTVVVDKEEYDNLMIMKGRLQAFEDYIRASEYSISKERCFILLGFKNNNIQEENKDAGTDRE